jgi:formamidopyrimidine-DNA glycosylase
MPEIPDLEVLKERFQVLIDDSIASVRILFPLTFRVVVEGTPDELLSGQRVHHITRRGKFLIFSLDRLYLAFNMMLTGRLLLTTEEKTPRNTVVVLEFASGKILKFIDFKKMGKIYITDNREKIPQYPELGVEPLSDQFTLELVSTLLKDSRAIKVVLTDQKVIAGIGNAYSDEILFHARLNPQREADSLTNEEISVLYDSILYILENAIHEIRSKLEDTSEEIRDFFLVHGKKGHCCSVCGSTIREIEVARRMTHVCPECQQVKVPW